MLAGVRTTQSIRNTDILFDEWIELLIFMTTAKQKHHNFISKNKYGLAKSGRESETENAFLYRNGVNRTYCCLEHSFVLLYSISSMYCSRYFRFRYNYRSVNHWYRCFSFLQNVALVVGIKEECWLKSIFVIAVVIVEQGRGTGTHAHKLVHKQIKREKYWKQ